MVTLYDVPAEALLEALADRLEDRLDEPDWLAFTKAGVDREFPPVEPDFYHTRAASVLRRIAIDGPVGIDRLSTYYGGAKEGSNRYGTSRTVRVDGSRKLLRSIVQGLEEADLVERPPNGEGRVVSPEGRSFIDGVAGDVLEDLDRPELERYA